MYSFDEHTADVRVTVEAASLEELFRESLRALAAFVKPRSRGAAVEAPVTVESADTTSLLVDFLNEALWRLHARGELCDDARIDHLTATTVAALLLGATAASFEEDVKAVTYHEAEVVQRDGRWSTTLVLDI